MRPKIKLLELFAGIGGFAKGLHDAGFDIVEHYFVEIEPNAIANYKYNFPNAKHIAGSVEHVWGDEFGKPDIITFGWPCQDNSIAGKRKGHTAGTRSNLLYQAGRIINHCRPRHFIAENVRGLFSVNKGVDFYKAIAFLTTLNTGSTQYTIEMQLLNTVWFLPQTRERTYFVGHIGTTGIKRLFPITENGGLLNYQAGTNERSPQTQYNSTTLKASGAMKADDTYISVPENAGTLSVGGHSGGLHSDMTLIKVVQLNPNIESNGTQPQYQNRFYDPNYQAPALTQESSRINVQIVAQRGRGEGWQQELEARQDTNTNTLTSVHKDNLLMTQEIANDTETLDVKIRRLTEIECERLQGFDDSWITGSNPTNWTKWGLFAPRKSELKKGKIPVVTRNGEHLIKRPISKTARYKLCGNAVTKHVVQSVGLKLIELYR